MQKLDFKDDPTFVTHTEQRECSLCEQPIWANTRHREFKDDDGKIRHTHLMCGQKWQ